MCWNRLIYMFTWAHVCVREREWELGCICFFLSVCTQMSASLCNTIVHCHLQWYTHTHKSQQIKTLHSIKSSEKPVYWWSGVKTTGSRTGRWRKGEVRVVEQWIVREWPTAGTFIISHCKEARWDNWSPKLNAQHAFLMSPHWCSFNI